MSLSPMRLYEFLQQNPNQNALRQIVQLPQDTRLEDWLAVVTIEIFDNLSTIYASLSDYCTDEICPIMNIGPLYDFCWHSFDENKDWHSSAPQYIHFFIDFVQKAIGNPSMFPTQPNSTYPDNFRLIIHYICKHMFRVFGHLYCQHLSRITSMNMHGILNTCFKHYLHYIEEFELIKISDLLPLKNYIRISLGREFGKSNRINENNNENDDDDTPNISRFSDINNSSSNITTNTNTVIVHNDDNTQSTITPLHTLHTLHTLHKDDYDDDDDMKDDEKEEIEKNANNNINKTTNSHEINVIPKNVSIDILQNEHKHNNQTTLNQPYLVTRSHASSVSITNNSMNSLTPTPTRQRSATLTTSTPVNNHLNIRVTPKIERPKVYKTNTSHSQQRKSKSIIKYVFHKRERLSNGESILIPTKSVISGITKKYYLDSPTQQSQISLNSINSSPNSSNSCNDNIKDEGRNEEEEKAIEDYMALPPLSNNINYKNINKMNTNRNCKIIRITKNKQNAESAANADAENMNILLNKTLQRIPLLSQRGSMSNNSIFINGDHDNDENNIKTKQKGIGSDGKSFAFSPYTPYTPYTPYSQIITRKRKRTIDTPSPSLNTALTNMDKTIKQIKYSENNNIDSPIIKRRNVVYKNDKKISKKRIDSDCNSKKSGTSQLKSPSFHDVIFYRSQLKQLQSEVNDLRNENMNLKQKSVQIKKKKNKKKKKKPSKEMITLIDLMGSVNTQITKLADTLIVQNKDGKQHQNDVVSVDIISLDDLKDDINNSNDESSAEEEDENEMKQVNDENELKSDEKTGMDSNEKDVLKSGLNTKVNIRNELREYLLQKVLTAE